MADTVIADRPPRDGREWDCQCARCGSSMVHTDCWGCGGEGWISRYEEDPLWYDEDELYPCSTCHGAGGWPVCLSSYGDEVRDQGSPSWCEANPRPGREKIAVSTPEWFVVGHSWGEGGGET